MELNMILNQMSNLNIDNYISKLVCNLLIISVLSTGTLFTVCAIASFFKHSIRKSTLIKLISVNFSLAILATTGFTYLTVSTPIKRLSQTQYDSIISSDDIFTISEHKDVNVSLTNQPISFRDLNYVADQGFKLYRVEETSTNKTLYLAVPKINMGIFEVGIDNNTKITYQTYDFNQTALKACKPDLTDLQLKNIGKTFTSKNQFGIVTSIGPTPTDYTSLLSKISVTPYSEVISSGMKLSEEAPVLLILTFIGIIITASLLIALYSGLFDIIIDDDTNNSVYYTDGYNSDSNSSSASNFQSVSNSSSNIQTDEEKYKDLMTRIASSDQTTPHKYTDEEIKIIAAHELESLLQSVRCTQSKQR